jgi:hypothetical protein
MASRGTFIPPIPVKTVFSQGAYDASKERLRRTAKYQRWILLALHANLTIVGIWLVNAFELAAIPPVVLKALGIVKLPICLFMTVAIVLLAKQFWHVVVVVTDY